MSIPCALASCCFNHKIADKGCEPVLMKVPPPVLSHSPATGELEPLRLSSPFAYKIRLFFAVIISAAFNTAGAYTKFSAYINFFPDLRIIWRNLLIDSRSCKYITFLETLIPIGYSSPDMPK